MDSLTQMTLGAAVGEVVLGKKAGNRAMLIGAIGGTIPDLDILAYFVTDEMTALAFHRGFTHSLFFAFTAPILFGWIVHKFYESDIYKRKPYKYSVYALWMIIYGIVTYKFNQLVAQPDGSFNIGVLQYFIGIGAVVAFGLWWFFFKAKPLEHKITWKEWGMLFFWSIITHPLLDSCTSYGTQLFQPFWDYRVALNNISVVDPIYTTPFLLCVIIAGFFTRNSPKRYILNWLGIGISSLYLLFTGFNKLRVDDIFEKSLAAQNIEYQRYRTAPTILNNILWQGIAEGDTAFYVGHYSFLDELPTIQDFVVFPKVQEPIAQYEGQRAVEILKWFSSGYYTIVQAKDGNMEFHDLRIISSGETGEGSNPVFKFILEEKDGILTARQSREGNAPTKEALDAFFERVKGIAAK